MLEIKHNSFNILKLPTSFFSFPLKNNRKIYKNNFAYNIHALK